MKNFYVLQHYLGTIRTTELQCCACEFIGKSGVIKYHQLLPKVIRTVLSSNVGYSCYINVQLTFDYSI